MNIMGNIPIVKVVNHQYSFSFFHGHSGWEMTRTDQVIFFLKRNGYVQGTVRRRLDFRTGK